MIDNQAKTHTNKHTFKGDVTFEGNVKGAGGELVKDYKYLYRCKFFGTGKLEGTHTTDIKIEALVASNYVVDYIDPLTLYRAMRNEFKILSSSIEIMYGEMPQDFVHFENGYMPYPGNKILWFWYNQNASSVQTSQSVDTIDTFLTEGETYEIENLTTGEYFEW